MEALILGIVSNVLLVLYGAFKASKRIKKSSCITQIDIQQHRENSSSNNTLSDEERREEENIKERIEELNKQLDKMKNKI